MLRHFETFVAELQGLLSLEGEENLPGICHVDLGRKHSYVPFEFNPEDPHVLSIEGHAQLYLFGLLFEEEQ